MAMNYSGIEICKIGIEIERNGHQFYTKAAEMIEDDKLKQLLLRLAQDELEHEAVYQRLLDEFASDNEQQEECCFDEHYDAYIKALANARVFTDRNTVERVLGKIEGAVDILETAMGFEKDAILYLTEVRQFVQAKDRGIIDDLIGFEKDHLAILDARLEKILASE